MSITRGQPRTFSRAREDRLSCFASERSQQALHDGVLRRAKLSGVLLSEAETCQRGQTGLGRQPALDVGWDRANWAAKPLTVQYSGAA